METLIPHTQAEFALALAVERQKDLDGGSDTIVVANHYYDWLISKEGRRC